MLPRSSPSRIPRESMRGRVKGRTHEIQRLIGRALRAVVDLKELGERTILVDCDVIEADGGTRTAAVTGAFVALCQACRWMVREGRILRIPIRDQIAGIGVGIVEGTVLCDLTHAEDSIAEVDMSIIMTGGGRFVTLHGDAETAPFGEAELQANLTAARTGLGELFAAQRRVLALDPEQPFDPSQL